MRTPRYMTDDVDGLGDGIVNREDLFADGLEESWQGIEPIIENTRDEIILRIAGHEVMSTYQLPYMRRLAEIVTRKGGNILNVGYGLGLIDEEIEKYRKERGVGEHFIVELNEHVAETARQKNPHYTVRNCDWVDVIDEFYEGQFSGIVYDGYPLNCDQQYRDGIPFIEMAMRKKLLKKGGMFTFYADAAEGVSDDFRAYLEDLGLSILDIEKVTIKPPKRKRQHRNHDHFIAPVLTF